MSARVPMSVLGGFLGVGKTTLLNRILSGGHGVRYAVLVNDFGELAVDGGLVAAHDGETVTFANGCVCCSMGDDLVVTLDRLLHGDRPPEHILVEASGVADPRAIADVATLHPGLSRDLVVVLADVETVRERYGDHRLRDTVARQLAAADLLVLNKCDRVPAEAIGETESWARNRSRAPTIRTVGADVPVALLAAPGPTVSAPPVTHEGDEDAPPAAPSSTEPAPDAGDRVSPGQGQGFRPRSRERGRPARPSRRPAMDDPQQAHVRSGTGANREPGRHAAEPTTLRRADAPRPAAHPHTGDHAGDHTGDHAGDHTRRFVSRFVSCPDPMDPDRLRAALSSLMPRVLRAKGFVVSPGGRGPEWLVVQASGRTVDIEARLVSPERGAPAPGITPGTAPRITPGIAPGTAPGTAPGIAPGIVFIGVDDLPDPETLARAVRSATARATPS